MQLYPTYSLNSILLTLKSSNIFKIHTYLYIDLQIPSQHRTKIIYKIVSRTSSPLHKSEDILSLTDVLHEPDWNSGKQQYINITQHINMHSSS